MTETTNPLGALTAAGVSIWLDDLSRERITSGGLEELTRTRNVVGVTTNPTIFANALAAGHSYDEHVNELAAAGTSVADAVFDITTHDVQQAADILHPIFEGTGGQDGRVSIEVEPGLARDTEGTIEQGRQLWAAVDRPNVMIKVPATAEGLEAIAALTAEGVSVNVTLIFSLERHREVINAYLTGLERARANGVDLSTIRSVASFFVSRVDTEVDKRLDALGTEEALAIKGRTGIANARLAYQVFEQAFSSERAKGLLAAGAHVQRPLWASTGVKDPALKDTLYVEELVAVNTVNTMPEKTMEAAYDHGDIRGDTVTSAYAESNDVLDSLAGLGVSYDEVTGLLEREGIEKFNDSWADLLATVEKALEAAR